MTVVSYRRGRIVEWLVFASLCVYLFGSTLPRAWRTLNTDFPNYYLTARLTREGVDPSRAYEWRWLQREKDHREIDQPIIGLVPITPFSILTFWPIAELPPLSAKHLWLLLNLALLLPIAFLLREITGLSLLQIVLLIAITFPLHRNFLYGQYYVVLLALLTAGCWAAQRRYSYMAGALIALGAAVKVFPVLLFIYFLRKRDWKALFAGGATAIAAGAISIAVFGWGLHRTYLLQVLPWTLRGECLDPYNLTSSSLSALLHRLFVYEPQWNPNPAWRAPWLLPVLHPILQLSLLAPAVLWIDPKDPSPDRVSLEWAALFFATLAITPLPASYHFTILILPMAILCGHLLRSRRFALLAAAILFYLAVGYPGWNTLPVDGWQALLHVPRLYALFVLTSLALYVVKRSPAGVGWLWSGGAVATLVFSIVAGVRHQAGLFDDYAYRVVMPSQTFSASDPVLADGGVSYIALLPQGYRIATLPQNTASDRVDARPGDQLSLAAAQGATWTETVSQRSILNELPGAESVVDAESPALSADGKTLAFLRQMDGRKQLFLRESHRNVVIERQLTSPDSGWNVESATFSNDGSLIMAATRGLGRSGLYRVGSTGTVEAMAAGEARDPAVSPDGRWLAYSGFRSGNWNLYLWELATGVTQRLTIAPCNQIGPSWEPDSKTLLYGSDCGRSLWFTAICRRRVIPWAAQ